MTKQEFLDAVEPSSVARMMKDYVEYNLAKSKNYPAGWSYFVETQDSVHEITFTSDEMWSFLDEFYPGHFGAWPKYI